MRPARRFTPEPSRRAAYEALYALYRRSEAALAPLSADLATLSRSAGALPGIHAAPLIASKD